MRDAGGRRPKAPTTQRDIAKRAGVSQAAVSRVMAKKGYVAEDVRRRIEQAAQELGYRPDPVARSLISGKSNIVAIVMANVVNPFFPIALDALTEALRAAGREVLLFNAAADQSIDDLIPDVLRYRVAGIIITTANLTSVAAQACQAAGVPVVLFHRYAQQGDALIVTCDNFQGGMDAANLLLDAGCMRLAYLGGDANSSPNRDRKAGWSAGIAARGLEPVAIADQEFTYAWGARGTRRLIEKHPDIDAICCGDDAIACGAVDALRHDLARRVPEDVSVIGFDDVPQASWAAYQLTTIRQPLQVMVERTLDLLEGGEVSERKVAVPCEIVLRRTVSVPLE